VSQFISVWGTSAFAIQTKKRIEKNQELYLNYGADYFNDLPAGCPCTTCKPANNLTDDAAGPSTKELNKRKRGEADGGASAKYDKKARNRSNRKKGRKE